MNNLLIQRVNQRLQTLGKTAQRASIEATGAKETVRKILDGTTKHPRIDTLQKLAGVLDTSVEWLLGETDDPSRSVSEQTITNVRPAQVQVPQNNSMPKNIPVLGTAAGSHSRGAFQLSSDPVDYVRRPPGLIDARNIYGLYVEGDSMDPQFPAGELIIINPHKPARFGDAVVVQCKGADNDETEATLGILRSRNEKHVVIGKHNPKAEISILRSTVVSVHKVLTMSELLGM